MKEKVNVAIFTRTLWSEMPRIRHQLTNLLIANGHHVTFFEKANADSTGSPKKNFELLTVVSLPEFIHHQLRPLKSIEIAANSFPKSFIRKYYSKVTPPDIIINFNYDFGFLKEIFPSIPLITFINDDFISQAKSWMKKAITERVAETCSVSDSVLTVSYPLLRQLLRHNNNTFLILPWAEREYSSPAPGKMRNVVLYFGFINHRIDFNILNKMAERKIPLRLIGPVQHTVDKSALKKLLNNSNVSLLPPQLLPEVDLGDVCCSIMAYDTKVESVNACSISNRAFNLLSYGIPLLQPALPEVIEASEKVIRCCKTTDDYFSGVEFFKNNFFDSQKDIQNFLSGNYSDGRYKLLHKLFDELIAKHNTIETVNSGY